MKWLTDWVLGLFNLARDPSSSESNQITPYDFITKGDSGKVSRDWQPFSIFNRPCRILK